MNCVSFILLGGDPYAFPNAGLFLLATLAGAATELSERRWKKNSRFLLPTAVGAAIGLAAGTFLILNGDRRADDLLPFWCAAGMIGGFLGAAVVKARKKRKNGDASGEESSEKSVSPPEKTETRSRKKVGKIVKGVCVGVLLVALAAVVCVVAQTARIIWLFNNFDECRREYAVALEKGEFARALEVALESEKIAAKLDNPMKTGRPACWMKALAYELTGDLDAASENYRKGKVADTLRDARLAYKKGEKAAAFKLYCAYPEENVLAKLNDDAKKLARRREEGRVGVMCEDLYAEHHYCGKNFDGRVLAPFATYSDFLTFMESEFKAQGEPKQRVEAMEFFRSIAANDGAAETEASDGAAPKL